MQEEMELLGKAPKLPFPDAPATVPVYHGSPYKFDKFDFENNLRAGEGALAFGPGGYLTGSRPLAEEYARAIALRRSKAGTAPPPLAGGNRAFQMALKQDPDAVLAWLQRNYFSEALRSQQFGDVVVRTPTDWNVSRGWRDAGEAPIRKGNHVNVDAYKDWVETKTGLPADAFPKQRLTKGGIDDVIAQGSKLVGGPSPMASWKASDEMRKLDPRKYDLSVLANPGETATPGIGNNAVTGNLRAIAAAQSGIRGPKIKMGIGSEYSINMDDFRQKLAKWDENQLPAQKQKSIYETELQISPNDMALFDMPISDQHPRVQGALMSLADQLGINYASPDMIAAHVINKLPKDAEGMRMARDAGIPATAYLRAGHRNQIPDVFNPDDFNFVVHDQDILGPVVRKLKKTGGLVS